ncbi:crossover junction endonuclease EME1 isoform X2 [Sceloporus undulatus]|uniref:crossover junction endonuclease EME1 isoform X2 n=1 Tax=Sceloporus undulatus TaxID=8520 RepID=UPI001C4D963E|nr:crossover junction endonuclease EME1 isoform X2 [Sceloporus undulatus]
MVSMMFPELGDSEGEELPVFPFLSQQPAAIKNPGQPSANEEVIELRSSDSEGSSAPSPAWKKSRGPQEIARAATHRNVMRQHSSESEDDEEEIVPLAERLKRKLLATKPSADGNSFTRILERSTEDSTGGNRLCSSNEKGETSLLRRPYSQKRVVASTWELSDSDLEPAFSEPEKQPVLQPPVSASDSPMKNVSHRVMGISLQPLPLQANTTDSQEALDQVHKAALQRRKERVARKALQEQEQARKKVLANLWKAQRPDQCLKHIQVILDPGLLQVEGGGQVLTTLQTMECSCVIESQNVPCSITWRRKTRLAQVEQDDLTEEPNLLVLVLLEEFLTMIHNSKQALVGLQLHTSVQVQILESWKEFADFASMFTKAVAEAPFKRERDNTGFSFCLEGDWISGSKVDRSGKGLLQVWKRQIQQFNRVGLEVANAIVAQYPSPMLLMEAYHQCSSEQERYNLLRETPVRRGDGVTATTRRVGPDLSKRIYLQMTSHNPDLSLDITG